MKKTIKNFIYYTLLIISMVLVVLAIYLMYKFKNVTFDEVLYSLQYGKGTSINSVKEGIVFILFGISIIILIVYLLKKYIIKNRIKHKITLVFLLMIIGIIMNVRAIKLDKYIYLNNKETKIYDKYYVNPKEVEYQFPNELQNLIYIYVESLETTNFSVKNGGGIKTSYIPNLEKIAKTNINFSNKNSLGGALSMTGTNFTMASIVSQTSGVPLKIKINSNEYYNNNKFLSGTYTIGEVLKNNGYNNYFLLGSNSEFGERAKYLKDHGDYKIIDYNYAKEAGWIDNNYHKWWGFEDKKLYRFAKEELLSISKNNEHFNFTILTADTHFEDGYVDKTCPIKYNSHYANSLYCTDIMLNDFIKWIEKQDFYNNTTIVITGDHLTMQGKFYDNDLDSKYQRTVYNSIINSKIKPKNNINRKFTVLDMYPTTLASLGVKFSNDRLGLGTNLYSNKKTIIEELGYEYVNRELEKNSQFYDNNVLKYNKE